MKKWYKVYFEILGHRGIEDIDYIEVHAENAREAKKIWQENAKENTRFHSAKHISYDINGIGWTKLVKLTDGAIFEIYETLFGKKATTTNSYELVKEIHAYYQAQRKAKRGK